MGSLIALAHSQIREVLLPGESAIDCTAGNGHDTVFLSRCVGPQGQVLSIDIQHEALNKSRTLCRQESLHNVTFVQDSHARLAKIAQEHAFKDPRCVVFNLGFLPRSESTLTTGSESSCEAIKQALQITQSGGIISVLAYRGHCGGAEEERAVRDLLEGLLQSSFMVRREGVINEREDTPVLWSIRVL
jgi:16S rRNA C1402 N4-methylase RsmH